MRKSILLGAALSLALGTAATVTPMSANAELVPGPSLNWKAVHLGQTPRLYRRHRIRRQLELSARTGGRFKMKIFYGDQLSKSKENLDGINIGAFEGAFFCASYHPGKNAPLNVLDLPFLPLEDFGSDAKGPRRGLQPPGLEGGAGKVERPLLHVQHPAPVRVHG